MKPLVILLLLTGSAAFAESTGAAPEQPRPILSEIVSSQPMEQRSFPGTIEAQHETVLVFQTIGRVASLSVEVGNVVHKGQPLASLDRVSLQEDMDAAAAALRSAQAQKVFTDQTLQRVETLFQRGIASQAQLEKAQANDNAATAQVTAADADLRSAKDALSDGVLVAPDDGVVLRRSVEPGMVVSAGTPILTLAGLSGRDAVIDVPADYLSLLPEQALFEIRARSDGDHPITAQLRLVEPVADGAVRNRRLRLKLQQEPDLYRIGALIRANYLQDGQATITLPDTAIAGPDTAPYVWKVTSNSRTIHKTPVVLGQRVRSRIVIKQGVEIGDEIAIRGANSFSEGQTVGRPLK